MKGSMKKAFKKLMFPLITLFSILVSLLAVLLFLIFGDKIDNNQAEIDFGSTKNIIIYCLLIFVIVLNVVFVVSLRIQQNKKANIVNNNINYYIENLVSQLSVGIIIFKPNGNIMWVSDFIDERFGEKIINKDITFFNNEIDVRKKIVDFSKIFKFGEYVYKINFVSKEMILIVKDITQEYSATHFYEIEKSVVGEIEIDNYQLFRASFSEEEMFSIQKQVKSLLDDLCKKYNAIYKQYMDSKFMFITNRDGINKMIINRFKEFESLSNINIGKMRVSLSVGFGADSSNYQQLINMAKDALYQSQTRGGDQVTVISSIEKTKRFGSKAEISIVKSKTKIKLVANNLKIKLQSPSIKNVVIYGHKYADLDAIGASYALYEVAKSFNKKVIIQNETFDFTAQKAISKYIKNPSSIFVPKIKVKSLKKQETLVIIVDCAENTRVENPTVFSNVLSENVFIFDHHRVSNLDDIIDNLNVYIESTASSASEIITELIQFNEFENRITSLGAQMLLNGISLDTNGFKKSTSSRTFAAASSLEDWGASIEETLQLMKISPETNDKILKILSRVKEVKPGYWLSYIDEIVSIDVVSMAADEILKIEGRKASFVIAQLPKQSMSDNPTYKLSARSVGVNVQLIAEAVGGGGHFNAAAAISDQKANESLETFVDNIVQAIISTKE